jgi:CRISPR-associated Csx2 family protein
MAKILISSLGAGRLTGENENSVREYSTVKYQIDNQEYEDSFVASALYKHLKLDDIIFIGTVKSIWEEVYRFFYENINNQSLEGTALQYYCTLVDSIEKLNYQSDLDALNLEPIAEVLGKRSQCILIKYGLNEAELSENFDRIIQLVNTLKDGDEIYIDISNSFRSLSMFLFLVIGFIKDIASEKGIKISGVYYGMSEAIRDVGYAPIVDLKSFIEVTDWIKAGYSLQTYGDSSLIAKLLENQNQSQLAKSLTKFSQAIDIGYLSSIRQRIKYLQNELNKSNISGAFKYLQPSINQFLKPFERQKESDFQLELAGWYFNHQRYATGYITLVEAILTYVCEIEDKNSDSKKDREDAKHLLFQGKYRDYRLAKLYKEINKIRLTIAHPNETTNSSEQELVRATNKAHEYHREVKKIFNDGIN